MSVGNGSNQVWASFPIRYATRRENLAASNSAAPPLITDNPAARPSSKGGRAPVPSGFRVLAD